MANWGSSIEIILCVFGVHLSHFISCCHFSRTSNSLRGSAPVLHWMQSVHQLPFSTTSQRQKQDNTAQPIFTRASTEAFCFSERQLQDIFFPSLEFWVSVFCRYDRCVSPVFRPLERRKRKKLSAAACCRGKVTKLDPCGLCINWLHSLDTSHHTIQQIIHQSDWVFVFCMLSGEQSF